MTCGFSWQDAGMCSQATFPRPLSGSEGAQLARIAAHTIRIRLSGRAGAGEIPQPVALQAPGASFVTLERAGTLRGCVGSLRATGPLYLDAVRNALRAMSDPRMPPVDRADWPELDVKVSVLTPPTRLQVGGMADLLTALRPGVDGLLLADDTRRATFLPSVWQRLSTPEQFVTALLAKGGWPADGWPDRLTVERYQASEFHDPAPRDPLPD